MAKKLGNDYRIWVEGPTAGTYNTIQGQQSITPDRSTTTIDLTTKDDAPYGSSAPGLISVGYTVAGIASLPDTTGFTYVEGKYKSQTPVNFQIRKGGAAGTTTDAVFQALCYITDLSVSFPQNGPVTYSLKIAAAAAPTIDTLA